jgi:formylglycine-generating enzyme
MSILFFPVISRSWRNLCKLKLFLRMNIMVFKYKCLIIVFFIFICFPVKASQSTTEFVNSIGMRFVHIPSGTFIMGSHESPESVAINLSYGDSAGEKSWYEREQPVHSVTITRPFLLQETEVTVAQFNTFVAATGYRTQAELNGWGWGYENGKWIKKQGITFRNPGFDQKDGHPVTGITWNDAQAFIEWLNLKEKTTRYRLPTEAEWEYACRAGSETPFYWGNQPDGSHANFADMHYAKTFPDDKFVNSKVDDGYVYTSPVTSFKPNAFGLYDMSGNVNEWCQDWYSSYKPADLTDPVGPKKGSYRVLRGGSWCSMAGGTRSTNRGKNTPDYSFSQTGFRVAWTY